DEALGCGVVRYRDGHLDIPGQSWLRARGHREAAHDGPAGAEIVEVRRDARETRAESTHGLRSWPALSPCSAPGRGCSQARTACSISSSVRCGCSRRSRVRMRSMARSKSSRATSMRSPGVTPRSYHAPVDVRPGRSVGGDLMMWVF